MQPLRDVSTAAEEDMTNIRRVEHYKLFRDYIEHEDGLVNQRLLWNINIQGFLFAT
jgi:hypothetical protein